MIEFLTQAFVTMLVIIDPFSVFPMFMALTTTYTLTEKRRTARRAAIISIILLVSFGFLGDKLLDALGISEAAFRITGGFLLLITAVEMVLAKNSGIRSTTDDESQEAIHRNDISVFPIAIPLIAGPGAMTSVVVLMRQAEMISFTAQLGVAFLLVVVVGIVYSSMALSDRLMKVLGITGTTVLSRVFGIILSALAIQNIINGIVLVLQKHIA
jgi:multiple antibiotic resistance protein